MPEGRPSAEPEPAVRVSQIADDDPRSPETITLDSIQQMVGFLENLRQEIEGHIDELNSGLPTNVYTTDEIILWEQVHDLVDSVRDDAEWDDLATLLEQLVARRGPARALTLEEAYEADDD